MCLHHKAAQDHIYFRYNGRSIHPNDEALHPTDIADVISVTDDWYHYTEHFVEN